MSSPIDSGSTQLYTTTTVDNSQNTAQVSSTSGTTKSTSTVQSDTVSQSQVSSDDTASGDTTDVTDSGSSGGSVSLGAIMAKLNEVAGESIQNDSKTKQIGAEVSVNAVEMQKQSFDSAWKGAQDQYDKTVTGAAISGSTAIAGSAISGAGAMKAASSTKANMDAGQTNAKTDANPASGNDSTGQINKNTPKVDEDEDVSLEGRPAITEERPSTSSLSSAPKGGDESTEATNTADENKASNDQTAATKPKAGVTPESLIQARMEYTKSGANMLSSSGDMTGKMFEAQGQKEGAQRKAIADYAGSVASQGTQLAGQLQNDQTAQSTISGVLSAMTSVAQSVGRG